LVKIAAGNRKKQIKNPLVIHYVSARYPLVFVNKSILIIKAPTTLSTI